MAAPPQPPPSTDQEPLDRPDREVAARGQDAAAAAPPLSTGAEPPEREVGSQEAAAAPSQPPGSTETASPEIEVGGGGQDAAGAAPWPSRPGEEPPEGEAGRQEDDAGPSPPTGQEPPPEGEAGRQEDDAEPSPAPPSTAPESSDREVAARGQDAAAAAPPLSTAAEPPERKVGSEEAAAAPSQPPGSTEAASPEIEVAGGGQDAAGAAPWPSRPGEEPPEGEAGRQEDDAGPSPPTGQEPPPEGEAGRQEDDAEPSPPPPSTGPESSDREVAARGQDAAAAAPPLSTGAEPPEREVGSEEAAAAPSQPPGSTETASPEIEVAGGGQDAAGAAPPPPIGQEPPPEGEAARQEDDAGPSSPTGQEPPPEGEAGRQEDDAGPSPPTGQEPPPEGEAGRQEDDAEPSPPPPSTGPESSDREVAARGQDAAAAGPWASPQSTGPEPPEGEAGRQEAAAAPLPPPTGQEPSEGGGGRLASPEDRDQHPQPGADRPGQTSYSRGTRRRLAIFVSAVALALGGAFLFVHHEKKASEAQLADAIRREASELPRVDVVTVGPAPSTQTLVLPGETAAWYTATIFARVNGFVGHWFNDIGDHVKKGQVLATIETPDLDAEFDSAKAKLKVSKAQVFLKEAQLEFARTTDERWRNSPRGVVSDQEREDKKAKHGEALAELEAARSQVELNQALVDRLAAFQDFKRVTAPFDGTIIERRIDLGNLVTAGSTTNTTMLYRMTRDDPLRVLIDAPQSAAAQLMAVGTPGVITADYRPNERFKGSVTRTAEAINPEARTLRVEVDIPNPNHTLVPGTYVNVTFELKSSGLIEIPAAALLFRTKGPQVAVIKDIVDEHGVVDIRDVTIARDNGNVVEISAGLEKGDKVALNLNRRIVNGEKVEIHDVDQERLKGVAASAH